MNAKVIPFPVERTRAVDLLDVEDYAKGLVAAKEAGDLQDYFKRISERYRLVWDKRAGTMRFEVQPEHKKNLDAYLDKYGRLP